MKIKQTNPKAKSGRTFEQTKKQAKDPEFKPQDCQK
jgi:hypothetical protein